MRPSDVGRWRLQDRGEDFVSWRKSLASYGDEQAATVWVEDSATGDGYIAWAHVEPAGDDAHTIINNGNEVSRDAAVEYAMDWMQRNPDWPTGGTTGLGGFDWGLY